MMPNNGLPRKGLNKTSKPPAWSGKAAILRFWRQTKGAVLVEFAVISIVFFLLIAGVLDYGHAWYMKQVITNASREGARYGITYQTNTSGVRIPPSSLSPTIRNYILNNYLTSVALPADANPIITLGGTGYTSGTKGDPLEVTVRATKTWFMISSFIPGMSDQATITAKTVMLCE
jgi:Flp pilus assembly protein TadG